MDMRALADWLRYVGIAGVAAGMVLLLAVVPSGGNPIGIWIAVVGVAGVCASHVIHSELRHRELVKKGYPFHLEG